MKGAMTGYSIPPQRELPPGRLAARKLHLLAELDETPRRPFGVRAGALALALAATTVAVLLAAPWGSGPGLTDRALAAVGDGEVLHIVTERHAPVGWFNPVSLETGKPIPLTLRTEVWFDDERQLEKTASTLDGKPYEDLLQSPDGWFTDEGPVYTCAWIAAHPVEATKARVSCNEDMENGTTPHHIPETPPAPIDPALAGFVDHYRSALASGEATQTGTGQLDGHDVVWLRIGREEVAIDASSYEPVLVRDGDDSFRVTEIDTQAYDPSLFARPVVGPPKPSIGEVAGKETVSLSQAVETLGRHALWLGQAWNGYKLDQVLKLDLTTGYGAFSGRDPTHGTGVSFEYRNEDGNTLSIRESAQCELGLGWMCGRLPAPYPGTILERPIGNELMLDGLYVTIFQLRPDPDPVEVARALIAVPTTS
jgi:hypothetical protein